MAEALSPIAGQPSLAQPRGSWNPGSSGTGCCWPGASGGHSGDGSPSRSGDPARRISRPQRRSSAVPPMTVVGSHVPHRFADLGKGAQVVMRLHQALVIRLFPSLHSADAQLFEVQDGLLACGRQPFLPHRGPDVQDQLYALNLLEIPAQDTVALGALSGALTSPVSFDIFLTLLFPLSLESSAGVG